MQVDEGKHKIEWIKSTAINIGNYLGEAWIEIGADIQSDLIGSQLQNDINYISMLSKDPYNIGRERIREIRQKYNEYVFKLISVMKSDENGCQVIISDAYTKISAIIPTSAMEEMKKQMKMEEDISTLIESYFILRRGYFLVEPNQHKNIHLYIHSFKYYGIEHECFSKYLYRNILEKGINKYQEIESIKKYLSKIEEGVKNEIQRKELIDILDSINSQVDSIALKNLLTQELFYSTYDKGNEVCTSMQKVNDEKIDSFLQEFISYSVSENNQINEESNQEKESQKDEKVNDEKIDITIKDEVKIATDISTDTITTSEEVSDTIETDTADTITITLKEISDTTSEEVSDTVDTTTISEKVSDKTDKVDTTTTLDKVPDTTTADKTDPADTTITLEKISDITVVDKTDTTTTSEKTIPEKISNTSTTLGTSTTPTNTKKLTNVVFVPCVNNIQKLRSGILSTTSSAKNIHTDQESKKNEFTNEKMDINQKEMMSPAKRSQEYITDHKKTKLQDVSAASSEKLYPFTIPKKIFSSAPLKNFSKKIKHITSYGITNEQENTISPSVIRDVSVLENDVISVDAIDSVDTSSNIELQSLNTSIIIADKDASNNENQKKSLEPQTILEKVVHNNEGQSLDDYIQTEDAFIKKEEESSSSDGGSISDSVVEDMKNESVSKINKPKTLSAYNKEHNK